MIRYAAGTYTGTKIGLGYMARVGVHIVATDSDTGKRKYVFPCGRHKSPRKVIFETASHYKTGMSKANRASFDEALREAEKEADELNNQEQLNN